MNQMIPGRRTVSLAVILVTLLFLLIVAPDVLLVVFAGMLFAVFLGGGGTFIARHSGLARGWGIGIFILLLLGVLAAAALAFAPAAIAQFNQLAQEIPSAIENLRARIEDYAWVERLLDSANPAGLISAEGGSAAATAVTSTFGALGNFIIMLVDFHPEVTRVFHRELTHLEVMFRGSGFGQGMGVLLCFPRSCGRAGFEAKAVVSGLKDVAAMGQPVEQRGCHLCITEDRGPFAEAQVCGDGDTGTFV